MENSRELWSPINKSKKAEPVQVIVTISSLAILPIIFGYLAAHHLWHIAIGLLLVIPALILFNRNPFIAIFIWLAIGPFIIIIPPSLQPIYWLVHRLLPIGTIAIIMVNQLIGLNQWKTPRWTIAELSMLLYILASLTSIVTTNNDPIDVMTVLFDRVIIPMCLYLLIRLWAPKEKEIKQLIPFLLLLVLSQIGIGLLAWFYPSVLPDDWLDWAGQRTTGSLRSYGAYVSAMLFAGLPLLHTALTANKSFHKITLLVGFFLSIFGTFISFSRAGWLALAVVLACLFYLYPRGMFRSSLISIPIIAILAVGPLASQTQWASQRLNSPESEASALSRLPTFLASVRMFRAKPILGWGYENFNEYDFQFYSRVGDLINPEKDHSSHNFFMTLLAEQGILGFFLFIFPIFYWMFFSLKWLKTFPDEGFTSQKLLKTLWLFPLAFAIINLFQSMSVIYAWGIFWINMGLIASLIASQSESTPAIEQTRIKTSSINIERQI